MTPLDASRLLDALRRGDPIEAPVAIVVAHPDDETIGLGTRLPLFARARLIQITDGAPAAMGDAAAAGFADREGYRAGRAAERDRALAMLGAQMPVETLGIGDQEAVLHLPALVAAMRRNLTGAAAVITHAYEGGHPDHDAAAFAVQSACELMAATHERAPLRLEFAGYHRRAEARVTGTFLSDEGGHVRAVVTPGQLAAKRRALAAYRSQAEVIAWFDPSVERIRAAPTYDFRRPPASEPALYDSWGWALTSAHWRRHAGAALDLVFGREAV